MDWLRNANVRPGPTANVNRSLPAGWEQGYDSKTGRPYYFNIATQQSRWEVPSADLGNPQAQPVNRGGNSYVTRFLPHGWEQAVDNKTGRLMYFNRSTQQSSFEVPSGDMMNPQNQTMNQGGSHGFQQLQVSMQQSGGYANGQQQQQHGAMGGAPSRGQQQQRSGGTVDHSASGAGSSSAGTMGGSQSRGQQQQQQQRSGGAYDQSSGNAQNDDSTNHEAAGVRPEERGRKYDPKTIFQGLAAKNDDENAWREDSWYDENQQHGEYEDYSQNYNRNRGQESSGMVSLARRGLGDDALPSNDNFTWRVSNATEINFSENYITGDGLSWILRPCDWFENLRVVKLHKNNLGDGAANSLVKLCRCAPVLTEMHLSHNRFTWNGADKIVPAACKRQLIKDADGGAPHFWLRLEQNHIEGAKDLFREWEFRGLELSLYHKSDQRVPRGVILPYFFKQRTRDAERDEPSNWWDQQQEYWGGHSASQEWWGDQWSSWDYGEYNTGGNRSYGQSSKNDGKGKGKTGNKGKSAAGDWSWDQSGADGDPKRKAQPKAKVKVKDLEAKEGGSKGKGGKDKQASEEGQSTEKGAGGKAKGGESRKDAGGKGKGSETGNAVSDDTLEAFCKECGESENGGDKVLDLANNTLTGAGFSAFQELCLGLAKLAILKLHKNSLTDAAAPFLAEICKGSSSLCELHLSHNMITRAGAEILVPAACTARAEDDALPPLWLRLEYNEISEPQELLDAWKSDDLPLKYYTKGTSRLNLTKGVHLPYFLLQGKPTGYAPRPDNKVKKEESSESAKPVDNSKPKLKWKVKVQPQAANEEVDGTAEAKDVEDTEGAAEDEVVEAKDSETKDEAAKESPSCTGDEAPQQEETADTAKEKKKRRRQRGADEDPDDCERTVFSDGEESEGSAG